MPYFTSNYYNPKIIIQSKAKPQGAVTEKIKSEYPQSHIKIKSPPPDVAESYPPHEREEKPPKTSTYSGIGTVKTAVIVFLLYVFAIRSVNMTVPDFVTELYMAAIETTTSVYNTVYALHQQKSSIFPEESGDPQEVSGVEAGIFEDTAEAAENSGFYFEKYIGASTEPEQENAVKQLQVSAGDYTDGVLKRDLSRSSDKIYLQNETKLTPDVNAMAVSAYPIASIAYGEENPQVLIVHTHGTESYSDSKTGTSRSTDKAENVVRVGSELEKLLNFYGVPTIHSETMHDELSYITAYSSSKKEVQRILAQHQSIKYVIDLHRDALPSENATPVKPYTEINGEGTAQIMLVIGTNAGGGNHPDYTQNLTVAAHIQKSINELYPTLARPINVRNAIFNQNLCDGSILLEVGSDANTLEEALRAVRLFGEAFARVIKNNKI